MKETHTTKPQNRLIVVYPGRFQPFHLGHQCLYEHLCEKFGKDNVWIASSNVRSNKSPLTFRQKKQLAVKCFGVPASRFVKCASPYNPTEILEKFDKDTTSLVLALGAKDTGRLAESAYFEMLPRRIKGPLKNSNQITYVFHGPMFAKGRNATQIREQFSDPKITLELKRTRFLKMFGSFDAKIFEALIKH